MWFALVSSACDPYAKQREEAQRRIAPVYDAKGKLTEARFDSDNDGRMDAVSYMDGARLLRIELDRDGDGKVERWEHYLEGRILEKVGVSTKRNGKPNRYEHFREGRLVTADEDTDGDGRIDKWEVYEGMRLESVAFDTTRRGTPDRRFVYGPGGTARVEVDRQGIGVFVPVGPGARD